MPDCVLFRTQPQTQRSPPAPPSQCRWAIMAPAHDFRFPSGQSDQPWGSQPHQEALPPKSTRAHPLRVRPRSSLAPPRAHPLLAPPSVAPVLQQDRPSPEIVSASEAHAETGRPGWHRRAADATCCRSRSTDVQTLVEVSSWRRFELAPRLRF